MYESWLTYASLWLLFCHNKCHKMFFFYISVSDNLATDYIKLMACCHRTDRYHGVHVAD